MAVIKCESCGAPLEFSEGMGTIKCDWCGYTQTICADEKGLSIEQMIEWAKKYESPFFYKDSQKALLWYEKAAETGDFFAERRCGEIYI